MMVMLIKKEWLDRNDSLWTVDDISFNRATTILREHNITIKALSGHGNMGLRKKDIKPYVENKNAKTAVKIPLE